MGTLREYIKRPTGQLYNDLRKPTAQKRMHSMTLPCTTVKMTPEPCYIMKAHIKIHKGLMMRHTQCNQEIVPMHRQCVWSVVAQNLDSLKGTFGSGDRRVCCWGSWTFALAALGSDTPGHPAAADETQNHTCPPTRSHVLLLLAKTKTWSECACLLKYK